MLSAPAHGRLAAALLIGATAFGAAPAAAQQSGLTHWRLVRDTASAGSGPRVTASVGYMTMGGMRRVDVAFASDVDAYALVAHVGPDGMLRVVFPATPRGAGFVHAGDTIVVPPFPGGRDSVMPSRATTRRAAAAAESYDGGSSYLFIVASSSPLRTQGMVDQGRWATLALDAGDLADPRPAIAELARTFGGAADGALYTLAYVHANDEINTVAGGHRVGPSAPAGFRQLPLTQGYEIAGPYLQSLADLSAYAGLPGYGQVLESSPDAFDNGYASGFAYGLDDGLAFGGGGYFHGSRFSPRFRSRVNGCDVSGGVPNGGLGGMNSSAGLFAPGFPAFGSPAFGACGGNVTPKYTPAVGLRADQLPRALSARPVPPPSPASSTGRAMSAREFEPTVFTKAPLGGPIPYGSSAGGYAAPVYGAPPLIVAPANGSRGYSGYVRAGGGARVPANAPNAGRAGAGSPGAGPARAAVPHASRARSVAGRTH